MKAKINEVFRKMKKPLIIRLCFFSVLILIVFSFFFLAFPPSGKKIYVNDFTGKSKFISDLSPDARLSEAGDGGRKIISNPVYFNLRTLGNFDKAIVNYEYDSKSLKNLIIESGPLVDSAIWRYDLVPIENGFVDSLCSDWHSQAEGGLMFCQREANYSSLEEFLLSEIDPEEIAVYNYKLNKEYLLPLYKKNEQLLEIDTKLRGQYQFYTYIKDEILNFKFEFVDLNQNKDSDRIDVNLYYNDNLIDYKVLEDDGNTSDNGVPSQTRELSLETYLLPEGVYKIEVRANDDIITESIKTTQNKLSFVNKINLAPGEFEDITLFTDSKNISATTIHPDKLQEISASSTILVLDETYKQFSASLSESDFDSGLAELSLDKSGVIISGNGVFSFSCDAFFNPKYKRVDENLDINKIKYIVADYLSPRVLDTQKIAEFEVDLASAYNEQGVYSFILSIPSLKGSGDEWVKINKIKIELTGKSLFDIVKEKLHKIIK